MSLNELQDDQQVVIVVTAGQLKEFFCSITPQSVNTVSKRPISAEVNTIGAKKILTEKGYNVKVTQSLKKKLAEHGITWTRRGREDWYKTADVEAIPVKD
jgi:hypothetical protein